MADRFDMVPIRQAWDALREPARPEPLELFRTLPAGEDGEPYDLDLSPWAAAVFEWWIAPPGTCEWIYLIQGSQTSKTTTMMGLLLYAAKYDPDPAFWIGSLEEETDKFCVQRLKPWLETADKSTKTGKKVDWRKVDIRIYGRLLLHLGWATSGAKLRSWPCRYIFGDECGAWPASLPKFGSPLAYVKKRTRRFRNRRGIFATTPSDEYHPSWQEARAANFGRWHVPCPHCHTYQYLTFKNLKFDHARRKDGTWDLEDVARSTYYECPHCGAHLTDADKAAMIRAGRIEWVDPDTGEPRAFDAGNLSRTLQVPATYSLFTPWGALARAFLEAKAGGNETLRIFVTDELAEPWKPPGEAPEKTTLRACADDNLARGHVRPEAIALTSFVDVQIDHVYYIIRAWGHGPLCRSWQVAYGMLPIPPAGLEILDDVLLTDWDGRPIDMTFIDSGYRPEIVYPYCLAHPGGRIAPSKGITGSRAAAPVRPSIVEKLAGRQLAAPLTLYLLNADHWKAWVHEHARIKAGDPGEWRILPHAAEDNGYLDQILAESRQRTIVKGRPVLEWRLTNRAAGNHYLDCEAGAAAAAWYPLRLHAYKAPEPQALPPAEPAARPAEVPRQREERSDAWTPTPLYA